MKKIFGIFVVLMMVAGTFVSCKMPTDAGKGKKDASTDLLGINFTIIDENEYVVLADAVLYAENFSFSTDEGESKETRIKCIIPKEFCSSLKGKVLSVCYESEFEDGRWEYEDFTIVRLTLNNNQYYGIYKVDPLNGILSLTGELGKIDKFEYISSVATPGVYELKDGELTIKVEISSY